MAVTDQQKLDFLLKKIGYTKTKTGSVVGTGAISGTPKQPFAEAIPSPLVVPNSSLWNEAGSIPATAPGSDTPQVKVYLAASSGLRMTADSTSSGQRAYIAYSTYGNTSSARLTNWIDTQFGASYLIKVYKGDPNSGGVALSAAGSGANDGWFFDYSAGVLNFNDTSVPSGVTDTNIYIVGYRYIGQTGAPTSGISTFSNLDLTVERNLDVGKQGGVSTFRHNVQLLDNDKLQFGDAQDLQIFHDGNNSAINNFGGGGLYIRGNGTNSLQLQAKNNEPSVLCRPDGVVELYYDNTKRFETTNTGINVTGDGVFSGNVSIGGTLTYEDVKNVDSVGIVTARAGIRVTGGVIEAQAGENKIPSLYAAMGNLPSAGSYHGMFAHVHATGRGYFAHAGNWLELVNREINGVVGTGTENYNVGVVTASSFSGDGDFFDLDVDGHTNLDNVSVAGVTTFNGGAGAVTIAANSDIRFPNGNWTGDVAGKIQHHATSLYLQGGVGGLVFRSSGGTNRWHIEGNGHLEPATSATYDLGHNVRRVRRVFAHTFIGNGQLGILTTTEIDLNGDLDVDGHTNLDNVSVAGVTTFAGITTVTGNTLFTKQLSTIGVSTFNEDVIFKTSNGSSGGEAFWDYSDGSLRFNDNVKTKFGNSYDFQIYHHNNENIIASLFGSHPIKIKTKLTGSTEDGIVIIPDGAVELYHDNIKRLETSSVGVSIPQDLDVDGHTNLDNVSIAGVTTFASNARFNSTIGVHDGTTGSNGQYLRATGAGVTWANFPTMRTSQTTTASSGQTVFNFTYNVGFLDVFVNGVKLTSSEFTATNGSNVILAVGSFVGDIVELVSYFTTSYAAGSSGLGEIVEDTTPQLGGNLDMFNKSITGTGNINITGIVTATNFVGDGSGLTGITASGSGVVIKDSGSTVGTAGTINFGDNLSVSPASAGIVTITGSAGVSTSQFDVNKLDVSGISTFKGAVDINADIDVDGHTNLDNVSIAGVTTMSGDLRIESALPSIYLTDSNSNPDYLISNNNGNVEIRDITNNGTRFQVLSSGTVRSFGNFIAAKDLDVDGHTNLDNVSIAGVTTFASAITASGAISASDIRSNALTLKNAAGSASYAVFSNGGSAELNWNNTKRLETTTSGVTVTGTVAATSYTGDGSQLTGVGVQTSQFNVNKLDVSGISTFKGNIDVNADLDVDGHTNLDNVSIAGVTTMSGDLNLSSGTPKITLTDTDGNPDYEIRNVNGYFAIRDATSSTNKFRVNPDGHVDINAHLDCENGLDVTGNITGTHNITASGNIIATGADINGDIDVDGHTNLDNVSVAGVVTATTFVGALTGSASGNAATATALQNARTIGGVSFDGTANINLPGVNASGNQDTSGTAAVATVATNVTVSANNTTNETVYPVFVDGATGTQGAETDTGLTYNPSTGNLTSTKFTGDGSGLTGITASGSGVVVKDSGSTVGTAGTINFGDNLSVSAISGGAVTITAPASSGGISTISGVVNIVNDLNVDGHTNLDNVSIAGFTTITQDLDVDGHTNLDNVNIAGVATATGLLYAMGGIQVESSSPSISLIDTNNNPDYIIGNSNGTFRVRGAQSGVDIFTILGTQTDFAGNVDCNAGLDVTGNTTVTGDLDVDGHTNLDNVNIAGFTTVTQDLDVDGHTNLDNATIAGVSTFIGNVTLNSDLDVDGHTNLDNVSVAGVTTFANNISLGDNDRILLGDSGINDAHVRFDGNNLQWGVASGQFRVSANTSSFVNYAGTQTLATINSTGVSIPLNLDVDGHTNLDNVSIAGVSTFNTDVEFKGSSGSNILFDASQDALEFSDSATLAFGSHPGTGDYQINYVNGGDFAILAMSGGSQDLVIGSYASGTTTKNLVSKRSNNAIELYFGGNKKFETTNTGVTVTGTLAATAVTGDGSGLTGVSANIGITTNLSGSFTASAGSPSTINTFGYGSGDLVVEYTIYIKNGSDFQTQKLLAMRDGTTIHSTQFAVMFSSSLLVQCDATISSGNILLRATPETGVSGSTTYKVKREVM